MNHTSTACETHHFTLVYGGEYQDLPSKLLDAIYEAGCDDSHVGICEGVLRITFDREAASFRDALLSAIGDIEKAGCGLILSRVDAD